MVAIEYTPSANRSQRRAGRTRNRLMEAALAKFSEKGVDATSIEDITELADLGKGTFYRHFSNKDEVLMALVEEAVDQLVEDLRGRNQTYPDLQTVLEHLLDAHTRFFNEQNEKFVLLFQGRLMLKLQRDSNTELEQPFMHYLKEIELQIAPYVPQPVAAAKVRHLAYAVAGFVSGFLSFAMIGMTPAEIEASLGPLRRAFVASSSAFLGR